MSTIKIILFLLASAAVLVVLARQFRDWSGRFQQYMSKGSKNTLGTDALWSSAFGTFMSRALILFFALMLIVFIFVVVFSEY